MASVEIRQLSVSYSVGPETVRAVADVDFNVENAEFVSLVGPSGCGKTTVLKTIAGLIAPTAGTVSVAGESPEQLRRRGAIGVVFQEPSLLPWRDVPGNTALLAELRGDEPRDVAYRVAELIELVGLSGFERMKPAELSGGMQQRVALGRALALDPSLLLMDEPFAALDEITRTRMGSELTRIADQTRSTIVFVTHSMQEALFLSDRIIMMTAHPGRIHRIVDIPWSRPRDLAFRNEVSFLELLSELSSELHSATG